MTPAERWQGQPATRQELFRQGRELRRVRPRSSLGYGFSTDRDPVALLDAQNAARLQSLVPIRWGRMAQSAFTFYRGAAALMAHDLAATGVSGLRVQACGDAHLSNFGFYASPERELVFDLNDFDETLPAPWEWDVERLVASLAVAARSSGFGDLAATGIATRAARAYRQEMRKLAERSALANFHVLVSAASLLARATRPSATRELSRATRKAQQRTSESALAKLSTVSEDGELRLVEQPPVMVRPRVWPADIAAVPQLYVDTVGPDIRALLRRFHPVDVALRVVGVGSVGTRCLIELLVDTGGAPLILQVKEATWSVLEPYAGPSELGHAGQRVVAGQKIMQAVSDPFLGWTSSDGRHYYVRQFRDMKGSIEVERLSEKLLGDYGLLCGEVLARAHAQSIEPALIAGYLGTGTVFDEAMGRFAVAYAEQNDADHAALLAAIDDGRIQASAEG
ncbi:MAG: DUF2252 domain-containing protein [Propionicimonas sp.]|uniref:DUF2252 domain-containing protein n=1 Tax=Propionicimonas sp. TaxID=1955623 RepID=UPI002B1FCEE5|nr:DUF2252 domain-containing protein [Propionicimonas sp.]MEA4945623.1 DUF2252 domain-containing protein [Propionicimonas sp.]MEA5055035.1 DUF2252 domain-containing protein [Propionicimonas sp.]